MEHWVDTLATLHLAATDAVLDDYARRLASRSRDTATHRVPEALAYAADRLVSLGEAVDLPPSPELLEILTDLPSRLTPTAPVLTPGDACPDNNLLTADGALLIDFEFAEVRHPAWDVAYLRVPWPTCWCSWRLPTAVADRAVARYVERVAPSVPYVGSARVPGRPRPGHPRLVPDDRVLVGAERPRGGHRRPVSRDRPPGRGCCTGCGWPGSSPARRRSRRTRATSTGCWCVAGGSPPWFSRPRSATRTSRFPE